MPQAPEPPNQYLYEKIYGELKEEILSGAYAKGDWFPPERALKDRFGTTHLTVRNALAKLVLEGYIERYSGKGTIVIYAPGLAALERPLLRFTHAQLILADFDGAAATLLNSVEGSLRLIPLALQVALHHGDPAMEKILHARAAEAKALVILESAGSPGSLGPGGPGLENTIVLRKGLGTSAYALIQLDVAHGAREAVRHLLDLGHRAVALVGLPDAGMEGMREGWKSELASAGVTNSADLEFACAEGVESATAFAAALLPRLSGCNAILCASDTIAAGFARALMEGGGGREKDLALIGYGNSPLAEALRLTSIDPRLSSVGELVLAIALDGMRRGRLSAEPRRIVPCLVSRSSSGGPSS
jgi:DNA-binding LacI/PurR family transcriptional regulator/DNA-binding transcriptional regulator YhcF (GntR family)